MNSELARRNLRFGFYHSIMDWHHADYTPKRAWEVSNPNDGGNLDRYIRRRFSLIEEAQPA